MYAREYLLNRPLSAWRNCLTAMRPSVPHRSSSSSGTLSRPPSRSVGLFSPPHAESSNLHQLSRLFDALARLLQNYPRLLQESSFVFAAGCHSLHPRVTPYPKVGVRPRGDVDPRGFHQAAARSVRRERPSAVRQQSVQVSAQSGADV